MEAVSQSDKMLTFANAYGVLVRAGVITPNLQDEIAIREAFGLPEVDEAVQRDWSKTDGTRQPITIAAEQEKAATQNAEKGTVV